MRHKKAIMMLKLVTVSKRSQDVFFERTKLFINTKIYKTVKGKKCLDAGKTLSDFSLLVKCVE